LWPFYRQGKTFGVAEFTTHQIDGLMQPVRVDGEFLVHASYLSGYLKLSLAAQK